MKTCTKCGASKPESDFYRKAKAADGRMAMCKVCHRHLSEAWRQRNWDRWSEKNAAWKKAHPEAVKAHMRAATRRERERNPDKVRARRLVQYRVKAGDIPAADTQPCVVCGKQACEWHHHKGYAAEHKLDVVAVCKPCHAQIHSH